MKANNLKIKLLQEISTHKAIQEGNFIKIYIKGIQIDDLNIPDEHIYTIRIEDKDDLFAIFERFEEDNRCNIAEFVNSINH